MNIIQNKNTGTWSITRLTTDELRSIQSALGHWEWIAKFYSNTPYAGEWAPPTADFPMRVITRTYTDGMELHYLKESEFAREAERAIGKKFYPYESHTDKIGAKKVTR
jgi:hypothetical protein